MKSPLITISIVSHGQLDLVANLLGDLDETCVEGTEIEVILTLNIEESVLIAFNQFPFKVKLIRNLNPKGFGANHNQAFAISTGRYFCVLNPDVRLGNWPFANLINCLNDLEIGVVAPLITNASGEIEDSARRFPTPWTILCKVFGRSKKSDYIINDADISPDWVGGMFMLFRREMFQEVRGFNERYFLYYEDVDLCLRLRLAGHKVLLSHDVNAIHDGQRASHRNLTYLRWHLSSILRFFRSPHFLKWQYRKLIGQKK